MASGDAKQPGFKVTDRRSFQAEPGQDGQAGEPGASAPAAQSDAGGAPNAEVARTRAEPSAPGESAAPPESPSFGRLPAVDFHTFVLSLGSSALLHLGELEHPEAGEPQKDLGLAKHTIDILAMLEQKTRGNLTPAEAKLMESLLYDLRLRYVEVSKGS